MKSTTRGDPESSSRKAKSTIPSTRVPFDAESAISQGDGEGQLYALALLEELHFEAAILRDRVTNSSPYAGRLAGALANPNLPSVPAGLFEQTLLPDNRRERDRRRPPHLLSRAARQPILNFMLNALQEQGCIIIYASDPGTAPFVITFELSTGERTGIVAYVSLATHTVTKNPPADERRFQVKYGSESDYYHENVHRICRDPFGFFTALFWASLLTKTSL